MIDMYLGIGVLDSEFASSVLIKNSNDAPNNADSAPTYRIYGPSGLVASGSLSTYKDSGDVEDASNESPIVITSENHGLTNGTRVTVASVGGNTAANGTFTVANVTTDTFELSGSTGNGAYTSGGTWNVTGLYEFSITPTTAGGYASGQNYFLLVNYAISSTVYAKEYYFTVT
jgi:hypothetical protein